MLGGILVPFGAFDFAMAFVELTDDLVHSLSASTAQVEYYDYTFTAGGSFGVRVTPPRGTKSFFVIYSINGRRKRMTLGRYPVLSLAKAKAQAFDVIRQAQAGQDPAAQSRLAGFSGRFGSFAEHFLSDYVEPTCRAGTAKEYRRIIERELLPLWQDRRLEDITTRDVRLVIESISRGRAKRVMAARVRALSHKLFAMAVSCGLITSNPASGVVIPASAPARERPLAENEIPLFWEALSGEQPVIAGVFGLLLLTGQQPSQVLSLRWADIAVDVWTVGRSARAENLHQVVLVPAAMDLLARIRTAAGHQEAVFSSPRGASQPHLVYIRKAALRISAKMGLERRWSPLDLRRTVEFGLRRLRVRPDVIEYILGRRTLLAKLHLDESGHDYLPEVRAALSRWARIAGPPGPKFDPRQAHQKVVPLFRAD